MVAPAHSEHAAEASDQTVLARAKQAIADGDRQGALALLHGLLTDGPDTAASLTTALAQALIATARTERDAEDELARRTFDEARIAQKEICRCSQQPRWTSTMWRRFASHWNVASYTSSTSGTNAWSNSVQAAVPKA